MAKLEAIEVVAELEALKVSPLPMVKLPLMSKGPSLVLESIVALPLPPIVKLLLTVVVETPKTNVGVPVAGEKSKL